MSIHIKASHRGRLHKALHVPEGQKIPMGKLIEAAKSKNPARKSQAVFALNARKWNHK